MTAGPASPMDGLRENAEAALHCPPPTAGIEPGMPSFVDTHGFDRTKVTLANWRSRPYSTWSFSHVGELIPSARIAARGGNRKDTGRVGWDILDENVRLDLGDETVGAFLDRSQTDSLLVCRGGRILVDWHAAHAAPDLPHIVFSVTKSVTGLLCGLAQDMGLLDPAREVGHYLPETRSGAYGDCPVRHVLDMRVSLDFAEDYEDATGLYARYRRAVLWNEPSPAHPPEGLASFLTAIGKGREAHGGAFAYRSPNSDLLGLLLERVTGRRYADFAATELWQPMGGADDAFVTVDAFGTARAAGGLSCTARDLARIGQLMLEPGEIISGRWTDTVWTGGDRTAWDRGDFSTYVAGGSYRDQWYRLPGPVDALAGLGIHGQFLYIHRPTRCVIVKLGSQNLPQDQRLEDPNLRFLDQLARLAASAER